MFGKLLSLPFKIVNVPIRAAETLLSIDDLDEDDRILSKPLDTLADEFEDIDED